MVVTLNKDVVTKYYESFGRLDRKAVLSLLTDDVEWTEWGSPEGPTLHRGKAEFEKNMNEPPGPGGLRIDVHRMTEENDVVLAECTVRVPLTEGRFLKVMTWDIFEFYHGKIYRLTAVTAIVRHPA